MICSLALLAGMGMMAAARAESPMVEQSGRTALRTLQLVLAPMAGGKIEPAGQACINALPKDAYHGPMRQAFDRYSLEDQAQLDAFAESPIGRKVALLGELRAYEAMRIPLPEPMVTFTAADKAALDEARKQPAVKAYLESGGFTNAPDAKTAIDARTRELVRGCNVRAVAAPKPASGASAPKYVVANESRDAATGAIGAANFIQGRLASQCLKLLNRPETPEQYVLAWRKRNAPFPDAAAHYMDKRLAEAKALEGEEKANAVMRELIMSVRSSGTKTVDDMLNSNSDRTVSCKRAIDLADMGALDLNEKLPIYIELRALTEWVKANP